MTVRPVPVRMEATVFAERDRWVKELGMDAQFIEPVLRCAVIAASFDGRKELTGNELGPAYALLCYQKTVRQWLKPNRGVTNDGILFHKLMNYMLRAAPNGQPVRQRELFRATHAYDFGATMVDRTITSLLKQRLLARTKLGKADAFTLLLVEQ